MTPEHDTESAESTAAIQQQLGDPRILVVGASALAIVGVSLLAGSDATVPTIAGGFAWASSGVLAWLALKMKRGGSGE